MATVTYNPTLNPLDPALILRTQMEELLFDLYSVVGVAPRRPYPVVAGDLLASEFQGRFFIQTTSELLCFDRDQMLASKVGRGDFQRPNLQLVSMIASCESDSAVSVNYTAAFRYGQTCTVRRGTFRAIKRADRWQIISMDEDVRVLVLPESGHRHDGRPDRPRIWII